MILSTSAEAGKIFAALGVGASLKDAAALVGLTARVISEQARTDPVLRRELRKAKRQGKVYHLNKIVHAKEWRASAWVLEHRWQKEFGKNASKTAGTLMRRSCYDYARLTDAENKRVRALLRKALIDRGKRSAGESA